jgi:16S rRNA (cytosine967-C5)-methyltransferase
MRIPAHAVVSETVNTCKKIKMEWAKGLVNAILRRYIREADRLNLLDSDDSLKTSHPRWLLEKIKLDWPAEWKIVLDAANQRPPMYLRVNQRHQSREQYLMKIMQSGITGKATPHSKHGILLDKPIDVEQLPGFNDGDVSVQELAAQLSVQLLDLQPGQRVLDACAAPGGKTGHILESEAGLNSLTAIEKDPKRAKRISDTLKRLDLNAIIKVADIIDIDHWWDKKTFDRILLDAPCSATGVIRRHPDIKILRTIEEVNNISSLQMQLLTTLWQTLSSGGLLVYVTCSILKQENSETIKLFIENTPDCVLKPIDAEWGKDTSYGRQVLPGQDNMDGFFYACLEKK